MPEPLPLDSPRWGDLVTIAGDAAEIPRLLERVARERDFDAGDAFLQLVDHIYEQYGCCEATYATFPHLVRIGTEVPAGDSLDLWVLLGMMVGTCDPSVSAAGAADLLPAFDSARADAERRALEALVDLEDEPEYAFNLGLAAVALSGHPLGKLYWDSYVPLDDAGETRAVCPNCKTELQVLAFDTGLVVLDDPTTSEEPEPPGPRTPVPPPAVVELPPPRTPNPWAPFGERLRARLERGRLRRDVVPHVELAARVAEAGVGRGVPAGAVFSLLGGLVLLQDEPGGAGRYFHAWDTIRCPACSSAMVFAERWWGAVR
jgi:RNA polymerase subunit RPABC4/transcription elongation factor Spt4